MKRFSVIKDSKFEQMSLSEMSLIAGGEYDELNGVCISCMKRARKVPIGFYGATCNANSSFLNHNNSAVA